LNIIIKTTTYEDVNPGPGFRQEYDRVKPDDRIRSQPSPLDNLICNGNTNGNKIYD
jgi:hypothetical protein